jgi:hypothetical protein
MKIQEERDLIDEFKKSKPTGPTLSVPSSKKDDKGKNSAKKSGTGTAEKVKKKPSAKKKEK